MVIKLTGKNIKIEHDLTKVIGVMGRNISSDMMKIKIGWKPIISLGGSMKRIFDWATEHYNNLENI
jgi:hypothetical protein